MMRSIFFLACFYLAAGSAVGQNADFFRLAAGGDFGNPSLWTPFDPVPPPPIFLGPGGETDRVHFDLNHTFGDTYEIFGVDGINEQLIVEDDSVMLNIVNYETVSQGNDQDASVVVGQSTGDTAIVILSGEEGSEFRSVRSVLGAVAGSTGTAFATGDGFEWSNSGSLFIGGSGTGNLVVLNGSELSSFSGLIAENSGSTGTATVDGVGSCWDLTVNLQVGAAGNASLEIQNEGRVETNRLFVASGLGSSGQVLVQNGGTLQASTIAAVGFDGAGTLDIQSGALVAGSNVDGSIGNQPESSGEVSVSGSGSLWQTGTLAVGGTLDPTPANGGSGELNIFLGGTVTVAEDTCLFDEGVINLLSSGTFKSDTIDFVGGGEFNFTGGILHVGFYDGDLENNGGTLSPGNSDGLAGDTVINGDYHQDDSSRLEIEIGGTGAGTEFDFVNVSFDAILDGFLRLELINDFEPTADQTFTIFNVNSGNLLGFFQNVGDNQRMETLDGGGSFLVRYGATSPNTNQIILSDFQPSILLGDVNGDGEVNLLDVAPFVAAISTGTFIPAADINQDGEVNLLDVGPFVALLAG